MLFASYQKLTETSNVSSCDNPGLSDWSRENFQRIGDRLYPTASTLVVKFGRRKKMWDTRYRLVAIVLWLADDRSPETGYRADERVIARGVRWNVAIVVQVCGFVRRWGGDTGGLGHSGARTAGGGRSRPGGARGVLRGDRPRFYPALGHGTRLQGNFAITIRPVFFSTSFFSPLLFSRLFSPFYPPLFFPFRRRA